ncbi:hypothetical protein AAF712_016170 [Marasmius tenuissimus]|uniref:F-box domain-containing protein n=1 Tax=Marasmius tenuissimus TaxID=585030 RepID=A0ABR2Z8M2_9AGAR
MTIETLPPEIILQIFQKVSELDHLPQSATHHPHTSQHPHSTPPRLPAILTHLQVCHRWRTLILDSPGLFSEVIICSKQSYDMKKYTDFWFQNSKECPLDLIIHLSGEKADVQTFHTLLYHSIRPALWRLRALRFTFSEQGEPHHLVSLFYPLLVERSDAPVLEELSVQYLGGAGRPIILLAPPTSHNFLFTSPPPNLRHLTVRGIDPPTPFTRSLTHLDIFNVDLGPRGFRNLIAECSDLEVLALRAIRIPTPSLTSDESTEPIHMDRLKMLTLEFGRAMQHNLMDDPKRVLAYVIAPNLEEMHVSTGGIPIWLGNLLPDPTCLGKLRRLKLDAVVKDAENLFTRRVVDNSSWFRDLPSFTGEDTGLEEVEMVHSVGEVLGIDFPPSEPQPQLGRSGGDDLNLPLPLFVPVMPPQPRSRDVYLLAHRGYPSFILSSLSSPTTSSLTPFANLRTISIDTIRADEMLWLCRLLAVRPSIQVVTLSESALRSLRSSLFLYEGNKGEWRIRLKKPSYLAYRSELEEGGSEAKARGMDVVEWVKDKVDELWVVRRGVRARV